MHTILCIEHFEHFDYIAADDRMRFVHCRLYINSYSESLFEEKKLKD